MIGSITSDTINGTLQTETNITGTLATNNDLVGTMINGEGTHRTYYGGTYEVTPQLETQTISTKEKIMYDDITINSIPYQEVPNEYGDTVYIGTGGVTNGD